MTAARISIVTVYVASHEARSWRSSPA